MNTIIVDDEPGVRETLQFFLNEYYPDIHVLASCATLDEAKVALDSHLVEVIFLDINMPGGSGFDLLTSINIRETLVVFVTAYAEYAVKAFEVEATAYLLKPMEIKSLAKVISKVRRTLDERKMLQKNQNNRKIHLKISGGNKLLNADEIVCLQSDGSYTTVFMTENRSEVISKNIKRLQEEFFREFPFLRVHQSYILNLNHVVEYDSAFAHLSNGKRINISRSKQQQFLSAISGL